MYAKVYTVNLEVKNLEIELIMFILKITLVVNNLLVSEKSTS